MTVSQNFSQIDVTVIEINSVLGKGVSLSIYIILYTRIVCPPLDVGIAKVEEGGRSSLHEDAAVI